MSRNKILTEALKKYQDSNPQDDTERVCSNGPMSEQAQPNTILKVPVQARGLNQRY